MRGNIRAGSIGGSFVAYSGFPESITGPGGNSNTGTDGQERANQYRKLKIVHRSVNNWFGTDPSATPCTNAGVDNGVCAYGAPASNAFGSASNGTERGPSFTQIDTSAFKDFHITEGQTIGFRADAFNVFNIASYDNPRYRCVGCDLWADYQPRYFGSLGSQKPSVGIAL